MAVTTVQVTTEHSRPYLHKGAKVTIFRK